jgi:2-oxoglutarate dehydrogenase E1 component
MAQQPDYDTFLAGFNASFLENLYKKYLEDPGAIDPDWVSYFNRLKIAEDLHTTEELLPPTVPAKPYDNGPHEPLSPVSFKKHVEDNHPVSEDRKPAFPGHDLQRSVIDSIRALMLIRAYRVRGHLLAHLDPLGLEKRAEHPELDPATYGFSAKDYDRPIFIDGLLGLQYATLREILHILNTTYASTIGVEFMHIQEPEPKTWIQRHIENQKPMLTEQEKREILLWLTKAEAFEKFLSIKYPGAKRFGLEGGESLIPALVTVLANAAHYGLKEAVIGMAHRGRLNVLANILGKPYRAIFSEFQGKPAYPEDVQGSGDVKYHLGASSDQVFGGKTIHLSLTANPSHLEAVNPVVVGKVRAKQTWLKDITRREVMGILLHGDAAFAGQGLVAETLLLSDLGGYRTGGTIHIIINNQIGFTTSPHYSRSSPYSSDSIKSIQAPVFHVNGDDPEAVCWVAQLAAAYRYQFKKDILIDLFCYRRHGHNEMDEPSFTQPLMYKKIRTHPTTRELYAKKLIAEGIMSAEEVDALYHEIQASLQKEFAEADHYTAEKADWLEGVWASIDVDDTTNRHAETGVSLEHLQEVGRALVKVPTGFALHHKLVRLLQTKEDMFKKGTGIDWATAEALAFGTLLIEGFPVRLSGQDCGRGTFSQRHAVLIDQETGAPYIPLNNIRSEQAELEVVDSPLAEASVLGFELGYSLANPHALVLWEAQFGDFANGAQVMIDQFIASGEAKWLRMSGLVMLLPHGYEGQGPEHSSARLERYLQLCAEDNLQVANCTTAANYFHILRRQLKRRIRKPLILMTPKSLLRDPRVTSQLADMGPNTHFVKVLPEMSTDLVADAKIRRVILCTGKVYYDLIERRQAQNLKDIAIIRLEQLYPFPATYLKAELQRYPQAEFIWAQEEPQNMGAWTFIDRRLEGILKELGLKNNRPLYRGRPEAAATATGSYQRHEQEQERLIHDALND